MFFINLDKDTIERYDPTKFMEFVEKGHDISVSYFINRLLELQPAGIHKVITEESRLDTISFKIYGSTQYWWLIMLYNKIIDFESVVNGMEIQYPSLNDLESLYFQLKSLQTAEEGV